MRRPALLAAGSLLLLLSPFARAATSSQAPLLDAMHSELERAMKSLGKAGSDPEKPPYFISYSATEAFTLQIAAQYGAIVNAGSRSGRVADVVVRVGDRTLDNTHGAHRGSAINTVTLPVDNDARAIARSLWWATNRGYAAALQSYSQVQTESQVRAKEEDASPDFSEEKPQVNTGAPAAHTAIDVHEWESRLRTLSAIFHAYPHVYSNVVMLQQDEETNYFLSSEGSRVTTPRRLTRVLAFAATRAEDGMDLYRARTFEAETPAQLPSVSSMDAEIRALAVSLEALRTAPATEPFNGPAVLSGRAAAVFFHEVLGHRLEGQRQRGDEEGQTFTKQLNKPILPDFLSVSDDPTLSSFEGTYLSGEYSSDDEGQKAQRVDLIQSGVLKTFLMSRLPVTAFATSNGHGRSQVGLMPTGRQGNLIVSSTRQVPDGELRKALVAEARKQGKPYGLWFEDISSGFAVTNRNSPQAFQVQPLVVYRVYVDGRPDELVRGVSIVGTPQAALNRILLTGTKRDVFNGECGAESGSIPVSAIAPAMLVSEIETQRQPQGTSRPPILPMPGQESAKEPHTPATPRGPAR